MDSYIVRIYRRGGRRSRILVGTIEAAGSRRKMAFSNVEELWEILTHRNDRNPFAPRFTQRCAGKEVRSATDETDLEESAEGVQETWPASGR